MKINWKVRLKNKTWLASMLAVIVAFAYNVLSMLDVAPAITQDTVMQAINTVLLILAGLGVIVDPTTAGIEDSNRAMTYEKPNDDANG